MPPTTTTESLRALLGPVVTGAGFDLEELTVTPAGRRRLLRVTVDGDGGIDLDAVAEISRVISAALDDADVFGPVAYVLEVGSPGVERPLTEPRHWRRAVGRLVEVTARADPSGRPASPLTGRVVRAGEASAVLDVAGVEQEIAYDGVARAQVEVEFRRPGADADERVDLDLDTGDDETDDDDGASDGTDDDDGAGDGDGTDDTDDDEPDPDDGAGDPDQTHHPDAGSDDDRGADRDEGPAGPAAGAPGTGPAAPDRRG